MYTNIVGFFSLMYSFQSRRRLFGMRFVKFHDLTPGMEIDKNVTDIGGNVIFKSGTKLTDRNIEYINQKGYQGVYIYDSFTDEIRPRNDYNVDSFSVGQNVIKKRDFGGMKRIAFDIANEVEQGTLRRTEVINIQPFEDYDYYHAVNTTIYSAIIGRRLGIKGTDLKLLALAAMLHDIGMNYIPSTITNKASALTVEEYGKIKEHADLGINSIKGRGIPEIVIEAIRFHHENVNGTGYPAQLMGDKIPVYSKILHVADVLDAMTTRRPYKDAYFAADALDYIYSGSGILFDNKVVEAALDSFEAYALGVPVELSNDMRAVVIKHTRSSRRPVVKFDVNHKIANLSDDEEYKNMSIKTSNLGGSGKIKTSAKEDALTQSDRLVPLGKVPEKGIGRDSILLVDDSIVNRRIVKAALDGRYKVFDFASGAECLAFIRKYGMPNVVIMDIEMPGMDGVKTVTKMREMGYTNTPVIFLTAVNDRDTILKCKSVGAVDYILKPAKPVYIYERTNAAMLKAAKMYD